jgi:hypothetical protein
MVRPKQSPVGEAEEEDRCNLGVGAASLVIVCGANQGSHERGRDGIDATLRRHHLEGC